MLKLFSHSLLKYIFTKYKIHTSEKSSYIFPKSETRQNSVINDTITFSYKKDEEEIFLDHYQEKIKVLKFYHDQ